MLTELQEKLEGHGTLRSLNQILENMKTAYYHNAQCTGKVLSERWDTTELEEPVPMGGSSGLA